MSLLYHIVNILVRVEHAVVDRFARSTKRFEHDRVVYISGLERGHPVASPSSPHDKVDISASSPENNLQQDRVSWFVLEGQAVFQFFVSLDRLRHSNLIFYMHRRSVQTACENSDTADYCLSV